jgi:AcrR family transcriptional regulator
MVAAVTEPATSERLLDAAESLFAEGGVDAVSLRSINVRAGLNPAAVHYHFGSRTALVEAVVARRMGALVARWRVLLGAIDRLSGRPAVDDVVEALVRPLADLLAETGGGGRRYLCVLARVWDARSPELARIARSCFRAELDRLDALLERALPELPPAALRARRALAVDTLVHALAGGDPLARNGSGIDPAACEEFVCGLVDFLAGGLEAPQRRRVRA